MANDPRIVIDLTDNGPIVREEFEAACLRALTRCGMQAETFAKLLCSGFKQEFSTGNLRNSITFRVHNNGREVHIGTNVSYAAYVELGTGKYYPGGRPTPWVYQDAQGKWHMTHGRKPHPYLKPALADHVQTYQNIIQDELKNG